LLRKFRGYEVKTEGDAFMVTFFRPVDALLWCLAVQKALLSAEWSEDFVRLTPAREELDSEGCKLFRGIRVRMGIHTGKPHCRRNPVTGRMDYFGPVVNRAARVSDSAHGGQIVITSEVKAAYEAALTSAEGSKLFPQPLVLLDLGRHPYKGVPEPIQVFQISSPELAGRRFPPLRTEESKQQQKAALGQKTLGHKLLPSENRNLPGAQHVFAYELTAELPDEKQPAEPTTPLVSSTGPAS